MIVWIFGTSAMKKTTINDKEFDLLIFVTWAVRITSSNNTSFEYWIWSYKIEITLDLILNDTLTYQENYLANFSYLSIKLIKLIMYLIIIR